MKTINHTDRGHKECGGSGAHRWLRCPGSVFLARKAGPQEGTAASDLGTDTHELAEICITDFLEHKLSGTPVDVRYAKEKELRSEQQVAAVEMYRDYIWNTVLEQSVTNKAFGVEELLEHPKCTKLGGAVDFWAAFINDRGEKVLHILDFKNGVSPVDITHEQFVFYGVCFRAMLREQKKDIDRLITHVVQPNSMDGVTTASKSYTSKQIDTFEKKFLKAVHTIYVDKKTTCRTGHWCKWCPGAALCKARGKEIEAETGIALLQGNIADVPGVESLTNEQIVALALHGSKIEDLVSACKAYIISAHKNGEKLVGCKVVQSNPRRAIPKNTIPLENALRERGFTDAEIFTTKLKGIGELEKLLKKDKSMLNEYVEYGNPTLFVVSESDPRPEAKDLIAMLD